MEVIKFAKLHPDAKIPTKREEDAGYDIYPAFDEDYIKIAPHETVMIPTGLCSAFGADYTMVLKERGSTGTKGIGQRSGIIDSGYRGEWLVPITNHNNWKNIYITKLNPIETIKKKILEEFTFIKEDEIDETINNVANYAIFYPYDKAICQALLLPVPKSEVQECSQEEILAIESNRGTGNLGSSRK